MTEPTQTQWGRLDEFARFSPADGISMQLIAGNQLAVNLVTLDPGAIVPNHAHSNEQAGYVVSGSIHMTISGDTRTLGPGESYLIPGEIPHGATAGPDGCQVIDIFSPPRADYVQMARKAAGL